MPRDLFEELPQQTQSPRDLFAETARQEQAGIPPVAETDTTVPIQPAPSMLEMWEGYKAGQMPEEKRPLFEELMRRKIGTMGIGGGSQFKPEVKGEELIPSGEDVTLREFVEPAATLATGALAEPIAGVAGIVGGVLPGEEGQAAEFVEKTREALTYKPKTERGQEILGETAELLSPVAEFVGGLETKLGDAAYDYTGSPAIAAAASSIPTAVTELLGVASGKSAIKATRATKKRLSEGRIAREINEAAPTIDQLKDASRAIYDEIDEMGVYVNKSDYSNLVNKIGAETRKAGVDPDITPKAQKALNRLEDLVDNDVSLSELETLRKVAQNAASSVEKADASIGTRIIESIDDFIEQSDASTLNIPKHISDKNVSKRYKIARNMWGRARKSELIQDAFETARNQATGFENGIRTQFRAILNNKKKSKFFTRDELAGIKRVVRGDKKQNLAKLIGRLGFSEGGATNILGGAVGVGAGATVGGPAGAVIVPVIGQVSRKLAQRMTVSGAEFADQVIRSGSNARKITEVYLKNTPKAQRTAQELSELLVRNDIDLKNLPDSDMINQAALLANQRRAELAGALSTSKDIEKEQTQ